MVLFVFIVGLIFSTIVTQHLLSSNKASDVSTENISLALDFMSYFWVTSTIYMVIGAAIFLSLRHYLNKKVLSAELNKSNKSQ
jgi:uncharacterized membrane protein